MDKEKQKIWEKHKEYIQLLSKVNNSYVFVAEYKLSYLFLSDNFENLGYNPKIIHSSNINPDYLETRIHLDDLVILKSTQSKLLKYIQTLPVDQRKDYKHIYECRVKNADGNYIRLIFQQQILELYEDGTPWLILGILDVSPDTSSLEQI